MADSLRLFLRTEDEIKPETRQKDKSVFFGGIKFSDLKLHTFSFSVELLSF